MKFTLKQYDTPLLEFSADNGAEMNIEVLWVNEDKKYLLPLDLQDISSKGLESWIRHRNIPRNRAYVDNLLSTMGMSINRPLDIIKLSKGLSLNDCYWVTGEDFDGGFDECNLFDNRFSRVLGQIAFTGYGSSNASVISSSPEFTTNGMLPKCWRRENSQIRLYKGGTEGASNTGNEPYSEFYACQIAELLDIKTVKYNLSRWKGRLCSYCDIFTSKELSYIPVGRIVRKGGFNAVREFYYNLGDDFKKSFNNMLLLDAVIFNSDRHYGNFGFLVDNKTNRIVAPAPLFDHGNSLFNFAGRDALESVEALQKYSESVLPCAYDDFVGEAAAVLSHEQRNNLRKLLDFRFRRHSRYNLDRERLTMLEKIISVRAAEILDR